MKLSGIKLNELGKSVVTGACYAVGGMLATSGFKLSRKLFAKAREALSDEPQTKRKAA